MRNNKIIILVFVLFSIQYSIFCTFVKYLYFLKMFYTFCQKYVLNWSVISKYFKQCGRNLHFQCHFEIRYITLKIYTHTHTHTHTRSVIRISFLT